jgi:hypothetical protein
MVALLVIDNLSDIGCFRQRRRMLKQRASWCKPRMKEVSPWNF